MMESGVPSLDKMLDGGYPSPGTILVVGPPSIEKELLGVQFILKGLEQKEVCLILSTTRTKSDITQVMKLINKNKNQGGGLYFMDAGGGKKEGGVVPVDLVQLDSVHETLKEFFEQHKGSVVRCYIEILSPALMVNQPEVVYEFALRLHRLFHKYQATALMPIEGGIHDERSLNALKQVSDGVLEIKLERNGLELQSLLMIEKMAGRILPKKYYEFSAVVPGTEAVLQ